MHEKNRLVSLKRYTGTKAIIRSQTDFLLKKLKKTASNLNDGLYKFIISLSESI